ncbi:MAG: 30S ribosomal protein S5 [Candidatus Kerfeldbacteria bacterium]|nr:30S ribosomal protein S5 [Candidatus Kerfeldbacteria bacterium]
MANFPQRRAGGRRRSDRGPREDKEFQQKIIDIRRVTRVVAGGKRMRFRATVALGDGKGRVGIGIGKGQDVTGAVSKGSTIARKHLLTVPIVNGTIPHEVRIKFGAAKILFKPAPQGSGVIAGGPIRSILELAGIRNIVAKMLGTSNKVNNVYAAMAALGSLQTREDLKRKLKA